MLNQPWLKPVMECSLVSGALPWMFWILTIAGMIAVLAFLIKEGERKRVIITLIATVAGGAIGYLLTWLCSDVFVVFGVEMGAKVIRAVAIGCAMMALLICGIVFLRRWKRALASVAVVVALFATCIHVDAIYEEFPTIGSLFGYTGYSRLSSAKLRKSTMSVKEWKKLAAEGKMPANGIWFWAEGKGAALPNFTAHYGADGSVVSAVPLCHGIARLVGLEPVSVPTATGEWDTDYAAKVAAALDVLKRHDFVALHLEGPDEATHNHDLEHKIYSVECLSERVAKPLCAALRERGEDFRLLILSDHRTFMANGAHGGTPVPYMIYDSREMGPASGLGYTEKNGESGPFLESGVELMPRLFQL